MNRSFRPLTILAAFAAAAASQAVAINFIGQTTGLSSGQTAFTTTSVFVPPTLNAAAQSPYNTILAGAVDLGPTVKTVTFNSVTAGSGSLTIAFDGTLTSTSPGTASLTSIGTVVSSSGTLATLPGGLVTVTSNWNMANGTNAFTVTGNLSPVPEPSAFAALGLGVAALLRRRKRA